MQQNINNQGAYVLGMVSLITNYGMWGNSFNFCNTFDFLFILWGLKTLNMLNGLTVRSK